MRRPNLFIVGAPKCATTTLHEYLARHPECYMSRIKEPAYFSRSHVREDIRLSVPYFHSETEYLKLFSDATMKHKVVGESSTCMRFPATRRLLPWSGIRCSWSRRTFTT